MFFGSTKMRANFCSLSQVDLAAMSLLFEYVDMTDGRFWAAVFCIAFNPLFWNVVRAPPSVTASTWFLFLGFVAVRGNSPLWPTSEAGVASLSHFVTADVCWLCFHFDRAGPSLS